MTIITVPHDTLRQKAKPIVKVDKKTTELLKNLAKTLKDKRNPSGVGLAAPQIQVSSRVFVTQLPPSGEEDDRTPAVIRSFINPVILTHSDNQVFGPSADEARLEGCLSIPGLYGAVPRWQWVELKFSVIEDGLLKELQERFDNFAARVIQHELDHLNGVLFTDYSLEYGLPVYKEDPKTKKLVELTSTERTILETF